MAVYLLIIDKNTNSNSVAKPFLGKVTFGDRKSGE